MEEVKVSYLIFLLLCYITDNVSFPMCTFAKVRPRLSLSDFCRVWCYFNRKNLNSPLIQVFSIRLNKK